MTGPESAVVREVIAEKEREAWDLGAVGMREVIAGILDIAAQVDPPRTDFYIDLAAEVRAITPAAAREVLATFEYVDRALGNYPPPESER